MTSIAQALPIRWISALTGLLILSARNAKFDPFEGYRSQLPRLLGVSPRHPEARNQEIDG
jgi:hypothetical protein